MPWDQRGARTEEHIALMRTLWESKDDYVSFSGNFYRFDQVDPQPQPAQKRLPILIGGHTPAAKSRAGRIGDGWITSHLDAATQKAGMDEVRAAAAAAGRDPSQLKWFGSTDARFDGGQVKRPEELIATVKAYQELGVHSLNFSCQTRSMADRMSLIQWLAKEIVPQFQGK
jgi:hypothetical protein